jgi:predicted nucleic acid-binding protein
MKVLLDTSVLVAAMVESHPMHGRAHPWLDRGIGGEFQWVVGAHSLAELYHVLTAYPVRPRIPPGIARQLIHENIAKKASVVALTAADYTAVIQHVAMLNLTGGVIYDALILRAAERAGVDRVLTFNVDDFRRLWPDTAAKIAAP